MAWWTGSRMGAGYGERGGVSTAVAVGQVAAMGPTQRTGMRTTPGKPHRLECLATIGARPRIQTPGTDRESIMRIVRVLIVVALVACAFGLLRYCAREDACYDASGVWDRRSRTCQAPWCTDDGGRWVDGANYCIPRECVEAGLDRTVGAGSVFLCAEGPSERRMLQGEGAHRTDQDHSPRRPASSAPESRPRAGTRCARRSVAREARGRAAASASASRARPGSS